MTDRIIHRFVMAISVFVISILWMVYVAQNVETPETLKRKIATFCKTQSAETPQNAAAKQNAKHSKRQNAKSKRQRFAVSKNAEK